MLLFFYLLQTTETNNSSNQPLGFITFNDSTRKLLFQTNTVADSAPTSFMLLNEHVWGRRHIYLSKDEAVEGNPHGPNIQRL